MYLFIANPGLLIENYLNLIVHPVIAMALKKIIL